MEATSVYIKKEVEDVEYERSYHYSENDTLLNPVTHEEDYTVTVNPEAVLDIKYEREDEPATLNDPASSAKFPNNTPDLSEESHIKGFPQLKEALTADLPDLNVNRRKRNLNVRRRDIKYRDESTEQREQEILSDEVKVETDREISTIWNSGETSNFDNATIKMENFEDDFSPDTNYMEHCSTDGTTEIAPGDDFVIKTEYLEEESSPNINLRPNASKRKRSNHEQNTDASASVPVGNLMSLQESDEYTNQQQFGKRIRNSKGQPKEKARKTWFLDKDKGMWKRRSWYEEEAKNMMQKTREDLRQIEELYSSKASGQKTGSYETFLQTIEEETGEKKVEKREIKRVVGRKRSRYEEKTELMKRKTEEDEEFIDSLKNMFKRPGDSSEHSNQSTESTSSAAEIGTSKENEKSAVISTSLLTLTELNELNEKKKCINNEDLEGDKWKELNKKSREELEQEICDVNGKRKLTVPRKSMYEEKTKHLNRKTQEDVELIKGLQSLRKLVSKDSKEYKQLLNETSALSDNIKEKVENTSIVEYSPNLGEAIKKIVVPAENPLSHLIPPRWEADEGQGDKAQYAPVLYSNKNHPDLKEKVPQWHLRAPMIAKIWRELPENTREAYKALSKQNKLQKEEYQKKMLEEELKKHSTKKSRQSRSDTAYRASVPLQNRTAVRQSQRLMSRSSSSTTVTDDSPERSSSPNSGSIYGRKSKYEAKSKMLNMNSERDKAFMAEANLPVPKEETSPLDRLPGSHYSISMQMMAFKTKQEMATLAKLIPLEKVATIQCGRSGQSIKVLEETNSRLVKEENSQALAIYGTDNGKAVPKLNGSQRSTESPPVHKDVNLNQNSVFNVRKSQHNDESEKNSVTEENVLMCSECGEEFTSSSELDTHKTLSHNHKPPGILPKEDTALPFIKCEPVDEDYDKAESVNNRGDVEPGRRKRKGKGRLKVKVGKNRKTSSEDKASKNNDICDKEVRIKTEVL
ncbi:microtubule-associated protein futsch-like [Saccostrea echinata]|uniref:microtubule-associated protein futsch-like n=1 Tax=Saccostrea echinata TaxID=191078 RepID=UPI002A821FAF|nr:microtubule-associated protein futsch-like [Saccostrea echinata]